MEAAMKYDKRIGFGLEKRIDRVAVFLFLLLFSHFALCIPLTAQNSQSERAVSDKSPATASFIALSGTVLPVLAGFTLDSPAGVIMISGGLVLGPVLGYGYMDNGKLGLRYAGYRAIALGATIGTVSLICSLGDCSLGIFGSEEGSEFGLAVTIAVVGTISTVFLNLHDTFSIGRRVESRGKRLAISPVYFPQEKAPGMRAVVRF